MKKLLTVTLFVLSIGILNAQRPIDSKFGKGLYNVVGEDSSWSMKFAMRFQTLYIAEYDYNETDGVYNGNTNFLIRRARLKFNGFAYSPKLKYKFELGMTNRDISGGIDREHRMAPRMILDAVIKWNFAQNFVLWAGQTKLPGNRERVVSSGNLQFVNRSLVNSRFNIDRDMGFQLRHHFDLGNFRVKEVLAVSQGEGRDITAGNIGGYDWTGRLEFYPFGEFKKGKGDYVGSSLSRPDSPKLAVGVTYDYHDRAVRTRGQLGDFMYTSTGGYYETDVTTIFADLMFKYKGLSIMAEYADKQAENPVALNDDGTPTGDVFYAGTGLNVQMGYLLPSNWEVAGRYTTIDPIEEVSDNLHTQYTLGISRYIVGHKLKVQSDFSYLTEEGVDDDELMFRLQIDLHF